MFVLEFIESFRLPWLTTFFSAITYFGDATFLLIVLCIVFWSINKNLAYKLAYTFVISGIIVQALKIVLRIDRPFIINESLQPVSTALKSATGYSFPSGHTQAATALYGSLFLVSERKSLKFLFLSLVFLIGFSRIYLGVHTPIDVVFSILITAFILFVISYYFNNYSLYHEHIKIIALAFSLLPLFLLAMTLIYIDWNVIDTKSGIDTIKISATALGFLIGWYIENTYVKFNETSVSLLGQIKKIALGLTSTILIKEGLSLLLEHTINIELLTSFIPYFATLIWIIGIYPIFIKKYFTSPYLYNY